MVSGVVTRRVLTVLAAGLVVACVVGWGVRWSSAPRYTDAEVRDIAATRVSLVIAPTGPDTAQHVLADATGDFADQYAQSAGAITDFVRRPGQAAITGTAVADRGDDWARVLITALSQPAGQQVRALRLAATVRLVDGRWKLAALEFVG